MASARKKRKGRASTGRASTGRASTKGKARASRPSARKRGGRPAKKASTNGKRAVLVQELYQLLHRLGFGEEGPTNDPGGLTEEDRGLLEKLGVRLSRAGLRPRIDDVIGPFEFGGCSVSATVHRRLLVGDRCLREWDFEQIGEWQQQSSGFPTSRFGDEAWDDSVLEALGLDSSVEGFPASYMDIEFPEEGAP